MYFIKCMKWFSIFITMLMFLFVTQSQTIAVVTIAPAFVDLRLDEGRPAGKFTLTNTGEKEERFRIMASHFTIDESGEFFLTEPNQRSMANWLKFNPKELVLPPKSKRSVRYMILPRGKLDKGTYWAAMELESLKSNAVKTKDAAGRSFKLEVSTSVIVPIFGTYGQCEENFDIKDIYLSRNEGFGVVNAVLSNPHRSYHVVSGSFTISDEQGEIVSEGSLGRDYLLPMMTRRFSNRFSENLTPGEYTVAVVFSSSVMSDNEVKKKELLWQ